jgi:hypothetical protein
VSQDAPCRCRRPATKSCDKQGRRHLGEPNGAAERPVGPITRDRVTTLAGDTPRVEESANIGIPAQEAIMIPPSTTPTIGEARAHEGGHGYGLVLFASILLVVIGCFNLIYGIAAIANSHVFTANTHYVFANLKTWGWITLIIGILQLLAAAGVLAGNQLARWFAVVMLGLNAIDQMFFIPAYPFWSLMIIAMDVVALYGLCAYASRSNLETV